MPVYLKNKEKQQLLDTWKLIARRYESYGYKPTETTEQQLDYILALSKQLDQREASTLITLLQILNKKNEPETKKSRPKEYLCESCGRPIRQRGNCLPCNREKE